MDHKREDRTPPLARIKGVGRQQHEIQLSILNHTQQIGICTGYWPCDVHVMQLACRKYCTREIRNCIPMESGKLLLYTLVTSGIY